MKNEHLIVTGMTCGGCVNSLTRALQAVAGVSDVNVSLSTGETIIKYDENSASPEQLRLAVENAGYAVKSKEAD